MSDSDSHPLVVAANSICNTAVLVMLIVGIVFMTDGNEAHYNTGKILVVVSGSIIGLNCCVLLLLCAYFGVSLCIAVSDRSPV